MVERCPRGGMSACGNRKRREPSDVEEIYSAESMGTVVGPG